jgi:hypothetical protein
MHKTRGEKEKDRTQRGAKKTGLSVQIKNGHPSTHRQKYSGLCFFKI